MTPTRETLVGLKATAALFGETQVPELPVVLGGYSRGSYATAWAMHKNFVENCN